jgi:hypothetical protein
MGRIGAEAADQPRLMPMGVGSAGIFYTFSFFREGDEKKEKYG